MNHLHLRAAGTSVVITLDGLEAEIAHWGADLGDTLPDLSVLQGPIPHSAFDVRVAAGLIPQASSGWLGRPGLRGQRIQKGVPGFDFSSSVRLCHAELTHDGRGARIVHADSGVEILSELLLHEGGVLEITHQICNIGAGRFVVDELAVTLPIPAEAAEVLDLTGRWCRESHPQRHQLQQGTWVRSGRHGRRGHDASLLIAAGTAGFSNRSGHVWAAHLAWSGNHEQFVDAVADGRRMLGAAELLGAGEIVLDPQQSYRTPTVYAAFSDRGLDGITEAFYRWFRARERHVDTRQGRHRPVVLNTWEAVYFDHRMEPLLELAHAAAELGVERFVLDDGWFRGRRDDRRGLGDWYVDEEVWPDGLTPLIEAVTEAGMGFGLWVEPEMVSLDSDLARAHPDWIVGSAALPHDQGGRLPLPWRHQQVLDLVNPDAWQYVYDRIDALLRNNDITSLKWDQNRDLSEHGHGGRPSVHDQTLAVYRLMAALRTAHPTVEIESCSSGGARIDLGMLGHTDRVWASDCNDALERHTIQRWTQAIVPPELVGAHVGPDRSHTTGRRHDITFRVITALFGHFGIEWDIREATPRERTILARGIELYKLHRGLIHSGVRVNADVPEPNLRFHGVVAQDGSEALYAAVALGTTLAEVPGRVGFPGLDPDRLYRVSPLLLDGEGVPFAHVSPPPWLTTGAQASGRFLTGIGLPLPVLNPETALLLHVSAER